MQYYEHDFDSVSDYLHHRPPYQLVDRIVSISAAEIQTEKSITGDEFFIAGHFPGAAIFPGAMMQELSKRERVLTPQIVVCGSPTGKTKAAWPQVLDRLLEVGTTIADTVQRGRHQEVRIERAQLGRKRFWIPKS